MRFGNIQAVYLLWLLAGLFIFYLWSFARRKRDLEAFAQKELLAQLTHSVDMRGEKLRVVLVFMAVLFCLFSLVRPQWGFEWEEIKKKGIDILIAIDTSKSMLAEDVKPNRLERSKLAVKDLVRKLKGDRIGLIAFSGTAFLQCPLTVDYNGFMLSMDGLDVDIIPKGGTCISSAITEAIKTYKDNPGKHKTLVLITDGENLEGDPIKAAKAAKEEGIKIFCIGIGTKEGELIPVSSGRYSRRLFLKNKEGKVVKTRLDEEPLEQIAMITGGSYVKATGAEFGLDLIYKERLSKMEKREFESKMKKHYEERFQIFLGIALLLLIVEPFISGKLRLR